MREIDTFLEEYKKLETAIRNETGSTVLDYENTMQQDLAEKIKVCRIMRNYAQHNADYVRFLAATADMCDFLRDMTKNVEKDRLLDVAYGAKGVGEITTIPAAPAIAGAYYAKDGVLRTKLPMEDTYYRKKK